MSMRVFVGGRAVDGVPGDDRGLAYGDGLFETMRAHHGRLPWFDAHWARLELGAQRLGIALPAASEVHAQAEDLIDGRDAVLKLLVTRGAGARGYAPGEAREATWIVSEHRLPPPPPDGLLLRWCDTRLATQPALAGLKHCNRLEQVLARAEWANAGQEAQGADEGLMRSIEGDVVCATAANLFVLQEGTWRTPLIDRCGVAGVCRAWAVQALQAQEARLSVTDVETAQAVFLCNAVRGILPVARLGASRTWAPHPALAALRARLAAAHPGFAGP